MLRTLFGKFLLVLLAFGVMMTAIFAVIMQLSHEKYHLELDQRAASALAGQIAAQGIDVDDKVDLPGRLERFAAMSTGVDLYVVDDRGKILASSVAPTRIKRDHIDITPVRR